MAGIKGISQTAVVRELGLIAFADLAEVKAAEKLKALEMLGKYLGLWNEKPQIALVDAEQSKMGQLLAQLGMTDDRADTRAKPEV